MKVMVNYHDGKLPVRKCYLNQISLEARVNFEELMLDSLKILWRTKAILWRNSNKMLTKLLK